MSAPAPIDETVMIAAIAQALRDHGQAPDLSDDCGFPTTPTALVTTDTLVEGVHFDCAWDSDEQVGAQAAVQNLSDLAASGAGAAWLVWSLCLPTPWRDLDRLRALTTGFARVASASGASVLGGNLTRTHGPLVVTVTAGGALAGPRALRRDAARTGQTVFVSGRLGDAALGVLRPSAETRTARHAWRPHLAEAAALARSSGSVACMDISDGLLLDATRLARASGVTLALESARVPVSALFAATLGADRRVALAGGEDYVLLFTADSPPPFEAWAIGRVVDPIAGTPVLLDDAPAPALGWDHFS
jgi:thiamine-monophosphate kinase